MSETDGKDGENVQEIVRGGLVALLIPALALTAGVALATLIGTPGDDVLVGTDARDEIYGRARDAAISGRGGNDNLRMGGFGN